jgi:hypothetical protein
MNTFNELRDADRRLVILRILEEDAGYSQNEFVIQTCLETLGHTVSQDRLRTDLAWLAEQGLVTVGTVGGVHVAKLTGRGADAACGRTLVPGIKRPRP